MLRVALGVILYLMAFPSLYGVIRIAVRHGVDDAAQLAAEREADMPREPLLPPALTASS